MAGDTVCDLRFHGGGDQAVHAFAREDLDFWERELERPLSNGSFGENLTTAGVDIAEGRIGERRRIGPDLLLEITSGRIACRTFQGRLGEAGWIRRFTRHAATGACLRVIAPGEIRAGDPIEVMYRPDHRVTVGMAFRAVTLEREPLPEVLAASDAPHYEVPRTAREYVASLGAGRTKGDTGAAPGGE